MGEVELRAVVADIRAHANNEKQSEYGNDDDISIAYALSWADRIEDALASRPAINTDAIERIAAFLFNEMTGDPWTVAGVEAPNDDRDYYREIAQKVAALIEGETK